MLQRETFSKTHTCPDCGGKLASERDLFQCKEHGLFFAYGPQLLVRATRREARLADPLLPWENHSQRRTA